MVLDIALDENLDIFIDDRNDLATVEGRREVEQSIAVHVTLLFHEEIGGTDLPNVEDRLELYASRVAQENDRVESLEDVRVEKADDELNVYDVTINYNQNQDFNFEVSE